LRTACVYDFVAPPVESSQSSNRFGPLATNAETGGREGDNEYDVLELLRLILSNNDIGGSHNMK